MSDLIDDPTPGQNAPEFSVSEISGAIKRLLEGEFGRVRIKGEVGRLFRARSGHLYFDIKDDKNVLACTCWKGQLAKLAIQPEEGMEVVVTGRLSAYGAQSKYNLTVEEVSVAGVGALMAMYEKRKAALAAEGLFDPARKRPIPYLPEIIGVVTSPQGAVIRDILHRLRDRFPRKVLIWPVAVQGQACAPEVTRAIEGFNALSPGGALPRPDLIIVARGGGSLEDLWGFNEENVARAAAASEIPLISAVGHETDTTLIDFVSDKRAPTPTAAAELAVPVRMDLIHWCQNMGARATQALGNRVAVLSQRHRDLARALPRVENLLSNPRQRFDFASEKLPRALQQTVEARKLLVARRTGGLKPHILNTLIARGQHGLAQTGNRLRPVQLSRQISDARRQVATQVKTLSQTQAARLAQLGERLDALGRLHETMGYRATLERGFAVIRQDGKIISSAGAADRGKAVEVEFFDDTVTLGGAAPTPVSKPPAKTKAKTSNPNDQGSLF